MRIYLIFLISFGLVGCSARPSTAGNAGRVTHYTLCQMPPDQGRGTLQGAWGALPVPLVLDTDFYVANNGEAIPALKGAIETWNGWSRLRGMEAFQLESDGSGGTAGREIPDLNTCDQASYTAAVRDVVGIWKIGTHGARKNQREICQRDGQGRLGRILFYDDVSGSGVQGQTEWMIQNGRIIGASILLNFEGYNAPGRQRIDVESLLLHELGHVLGLLHSCNGSSGDSLDGTSAPACGVAPHQYTSAVMYPFLMVNQERRNLMQNDYNRVNCLY